MTSTRAAAPGASAQAQFERRAAAHDAHVRRDRLRIALTAAGGVAVGLALMLVAPGWWLFGVALTAAAVAGALTTLLVRPGHVRAWQVRTQGERLTAARLAELEGAGYRALHDRSIPGSRANIDHIVVGPTGVFVVETKSWSGAMRVRDAVVRVRGRRTGVVEQVLREADAVAVAVPCIQVTPIVCVHRAELPLRSVEVGGVAIVGPGGLLRRIQQGPTHLASADIDRLVAQLDARLPSAA